jgi:RimJ/RimL family protein N-acetyltransferase
MATSRITIELSGPDQAGLRVTIETTRLLLRSASWEEDREHAVSLFTNSQTKRTLGEGVVWDRDAAEKRCREHDDTWRAGIPFGSFAILVKGDQKHEFIGLVALSG